jgi:hypothetical protein
MQLKELVAYGKRWFLQLGRLVTGFVTRNSSLCEESKAPRGMSTHVLSATFIQQINRCSGNLV